MSIASWKKQFYSTPVEDLKVITDVALLKHALKKWSGCTAANMKKHGVEWDECDGCIRDGSDEFEINSYTCALCEHRNCDWDHGAKRVTCPLTSDACGDCFEYWTCHGNAKPMINMLTRALKRLQRNTATKSKPKKAKARCKTTRRR